MLFNSIDFAIFLPIVFVFYWFVCKRHIKLQNSLIVISSYIFYGWWDWRFLSLIFFSTIVDFFVGLGLHTQNKLLKRRLLLWTSICVNIGFLGFFKYYNFFLDNFITAFSFFGTEIKSNSLNIILPVGISFYTFQTMSYTIDVYKRKLKPTKDFVAFAAFVSFFPQLVAGPIERATNLLPQFFSKRTFIYSKAVDGMRQILWGLFKKIVIADNCAEFANHIFNNSTDYNGITLVFGVLFFSFQIYGDFSGYSDIAIGTARLFGFNLMQNFAFPYFSRDIAEFWRRWHISLSTWFRDYLYIPLGGSRGNNLNIIKNTFIVFIVSGFWHGANWTFIAWGALNALYFLPLLLLKKNRQNIDVVAIGKYLPSVKEISSIVITFSLTMLAWVFFRANNILHAISYLRDMFNGLFEKQSYVDTLNLIHWEFGYVIFFLLGFFIFIEWLGREHKFALEKLLLRHNWFIRKLMYIFIILLIVFFMNVEKTPFIYFQF